MYSRAVDLSRFTAPTYQAIAYGHTKDWVMGWETLDAVTRKTPDVVHSLYQQKEART